MDITKWCTRVILWTFAALFIIVPFILTSVNYELFEYNKMMVVYAATVIIVVAWGIKMVNEKNVRILRTPLDIPIAIFFFSQLIASVFSMDPHVSWFGYYSRFNGGMVSIISYIFLYYAFVSNYHEIRNMQYAISKTESFSRITSHVSLLLKIILATAFVVSLYGALEHFGFSISCLLFSGKFDVSCWVQDVQNRVFATLGQPNWLAAYLTALIPISLALALRKSVKHLEFWVWAMVGMVFFATLLFTKSRSGLIAAAVADGIFWIAIFARIILAKQGLSFKKSLLPLFIIHLAFAAIIFFFGTNVDFLDKYITLQSLQNRLHPQATVKPAAPTVKTDTLLSTGGTESGVIRQYVWQGAITAWKSSAKTFLIGTGTETFAFAFYQFKPVGHNLTSEWDFLYNKAHNEYLNYLATTGILGLGSYLLLLMTFSYWFFRRIVDVRSLKLDKEVKSQKLDQTSNFLILTSLFAGWVSILITNFFGFSVVIMQLFLFLFPAMAFVLMDQQSPSKIYSKHMQISPSLFRFLSLTILLIMLVLLYLLGRLWYADTLYAKGYQLHRFGKDIDAHANLAGAIAQNSTEPVYYDEDSVVLAELAASYLDAKDATDAAVLAKQSLEESDKALTISPNNVNFWKSRTKIFYAFAAFDPQFVKSAIEALVRAQTLSPTDPKITYNLAILYGRMGDNAKAIQLLRDTIGLKPNYRDAYAAIIVFYKQTKQFDQEKQVLNEYLSKVDPNDQEFQADLKAL